MSIPLILLGSVTGVVIALSYVLWSLDQDHQKLRNEFERLRLQVSRINQHLGWEVTGEKIFTDTITTDKIKTDKI